jgi:hypothetical protein
VEEAGVLVAKLNLVHMDYTQKIHQNMGEPLEDLSRYIRLIGRLLFLTHTRPNIAFSINNANLCSLASCSQDPSIH